MKEHTLALESCVERRLANSHVEGIRTLSVGGVQEGSDWWSIGMIFSSLLQVQAELILHDAAAHPVETHVKRFGALPAHVAGEDAVGGRAVGFDWRGRLWLAHLDEGRTDGNSLLAVEKIAPVLAYAAEAMTVRMV